LEQSQKGNPYLLPHKFLIKSSNREWSKAGDSVHSGNSGQGVQQLQGMFSALPDILSPGCFCLNPISFLSWKFFLEKAHCPPPLQCVQQQCLMAVEEQGEYF
jgi:hypothetical protein